MEENEVAHLILGLVSIINAFLPAFYYFSVLQSGQTLFKRSIYHLMWKVFWHSHFIGWILPAGLFLLSCSGLFTFSELDLINYVFTWIVEVVLIALPFTLYWALALSFFVIAKVHTPSIKEPDSLVWETAWYYLLFSGTTAFCQLWFHGELKAWYYT